MAGRRWLLCKQVLSAGRAATKTDQCIMELTREKAAALLLVSENVSTKLKPARSEMHPINKLRHIYGEYKHLFPQLLADENRFFEYFRMSPDTFYFILSKIEHRLTKNWANYHKSPIQPEERLVVFN